jgi:hypothetical protein
MEEVRRSLDSPLIVPSFVNERRRIGLQSSADSLPPGISLTTAPSQSPPPLPPEAIMGMNKWDVQMDPPKVAQFDVARERGIGIVIHATVYNLTH